GAGHGARSPGHDDGHAPVLPTTRLGRLRAADLRPGAQPQSTPDERRCDRGPGRVLARPPVAPGRARRPDVALRDAVRPGYRDRPALRGILAVADRPQGCPPDLGGLPDR